MQKHSRSFTHLTNAQLLVEVQALAGREREATAQLIASLAELDARQLYLGEGFPSLFTYCTQGLHLSEHAAYGRIAVVRAATRFPTILDRLADGSVHVTAIGLIAPLLTFANHVELLDAVRHKSKREVDQPRVPVQPVIRPGLDRVGQRLKCTALEWVALVALDGPGGTALYFSVPASR